MLTFHKNINLFFRQAHNSVKSICLFNTFHPTGLTARNYKHKHNSDYLAKDI